MIVRVFVDNIPAVWPHAAPLLEPALEIAGTHGIDDVYKAVCTNAAHLWVVWDGEVTAAIVTEFVNYPKGLWARFWLAGAKPGAAVDWAVLQEPIETWIKSFGCVGMELSGRHGWAKALGGEKTISSIMRRRF